MKYWVKWLMESAREVISPEQNAMFAGRSIDNAVELIYDRFIEAVVKGKNIMSNGRVWWKKIAEKRKERCKIHSMARAGNMKNKVSHVFIYKQVSSTYLSM